MHAASQAYRKYVRTCRPASTPGASRKRDAGGVVMPKFVFTEEQQDLRDMVRRFLAEKSPVSEVRRLMETEAGYDPAVWAQLGQLGLAGLTIPEKYGGAGCGPVEQLIVCEEMGAALLSGPYLASAVLAAGALLASGDAAAQADLLPGIASGETIATLAVPEDDGSWTPRSEEHTSELQSPDHLVCRLLLEKKNKSLRT